jgi:D-mannonate dehydratase
VLADQMREMLAKRQVFDEEKYRERLRGFLKG